MLGLKGSCYAPAKEGYVWHLACQTYGNQATDIPSEPLDTGFLMVNRGHQRVKKLIKMCRSCNWKLLSTDSCSINLLLQRHFTQNEHLEFDHKFMTLLLYPTSSVASSIGNFKIHNLMLSGVLHKKLFKKLLYIISFPYLHPAIWLKD